MKVELSPQHNAFYAYESMNSIMRVFLLSFIYRDGIKLKYTTPTVKIIVYSILFTLLNILSLFFKIQMSDIKTISFKDAIQMLFLLGYIQYISDLYFVYKYGRDACLEYFAVYDHIDRVLQMQYNEIIKKSIRNAMIYFTITGILCMIYDFFVWALSLGWTAVGIYSVNYFYFVVRIFVVIDIVGHFTQIEYRLKSIVDVLQEFYLSSITLPEVPYDVKIKRDHLKNAKDLNRLDFLKTISINREYTIMKLSRCYIILLEQADYINTTYGFRMLSTCISFLIDTTTLLNLVIRLMLGLMDSDLNISVWYAVTSSIFRFYSRGSLIFLGVYRAEQNYKQVNAIVRMLDLLLLNKKISTEVRIALKEFRVLLTSRPVQYHGIQFFTLNYRLAVSITSAIVTYTIILLQYMD